MKRFEYPVVRSDGSHVSLRDFLSRLPGHGYTWRILFFHGVGVAPNGMDMAAFEAACLGSPRGVVFAWNELKAFVDDIDQVHDCLIVASSEHASIDAEAVRQGDYAGCDFVLELFDSTTWEAAYGEALEVSFGAACEAVRLAPSPLRWMGR